MPGQGKNPETKRDRETDRGEEGRGGEEEKGGRTREIKKGETETVRHRHSTLAYRQSNLIAARMPHYDDIARETVRRWQPTENT